MRAFEVQPKAEWGVYDGNRMNKAWPCKAALALTLVITIAKTMETRRYVHQQERHLELEQRNLQSLLWLKKQPFVERFEPCFRFWHANQKCWHGCESRPWIS